MMKHNQNNNNNNRRNRSRGTGRKYPNQKGGSFDSNGPESKVRGNAAQVLEKYQALARDANSAGDRILAEGYLQHAEHYYRILNTDNENANRENNNRGRQDQNNREVNSAGDVTNNGQNNTSDQVPSENAVQSEKAPRRDNSNRRNQKTSEPVEAETNVFAAEEKSVETATPETTAEPVEVINVKEEAPKKPRTRKPRKPKAPVADVVVSDVAQAAD
ncbi:DUF4167 domain-containing protein [Rhodospirillales bacterium]|nr:DUF4167 domain-containing protein [Rhodospirillales bacterium]